MKSDEATCMHCHESIHPDARRCPACQSWQSRWAADSQNPRLELAVVLIGAVVLAALIGLWAAGTESDPGPLRKASPPELLSVRDVDWRFQREDTYTYAIVVGTVVNSTDRAFTDAFFYVRFFDHEGNLIDAFSPRDYGIAIPPNGTRRFKVVDRWLRHDVEDYARCEVELTWAKERS